jgi:hypothetical protein
MPDLVVDVPQNLGAFFSFNVEKFLQLDFEIIWINQQVIYSLEKN